MDSLAHNLIWMSFNLFLALLGVLFGWFYYYSRKKIFSYLFFILWILFLPNTIYLITDLQHIYKQFGPANFEVKLMLVGQYLLIAILGIITYLMAMYPVHKIFTTLHLKSNPQLKFTILISINVLTSFALVLGKYQRTHSWYVFTDTLRVMTDIREVIASPILFTTFFFFAFVTNLTYFAFVKVIPIRLGRIKRKKAH